MRGREVMLRTGLDPSAIERFLRRFYVVARADPLLVPAFTGIAEWERHMAAVTRFWCSAVLMIGDYRDQPLRMHAPVTLAHFARCLAIFEHVARAQLPRIGAEHMIERACRIAHSPQSGLARLPTLPVTSRAAGDGPTVPRSGA